MTQNRALEIERKGCKFVPKRKDRVRIYEPKCQLLISIYKIICVLEGPRTELGIF